jgi:cytochrome c551/c552
MTAARQTGPVGPSYNPTGAGYAPPPEQELDFLKHQASVLEGQMDQILKKIDEIEMAKEK